MWQMNGAIGQMVPTRATQLAIRICRRLSKTPLSDQILRNHKRFRQSPLTRSGFAIFLAGPSQVNFQACTQKRVAEETCQTVNAKTHEQAETSSRRGEELGGADPTDVACKRCIIEGKHHGDCAAETAQQQRQHTSATGGNLIRHSVATAQAPHLWAAEMLI